MPDAQLGKQRIDGTHLDSGSAASVSQRRGANMDFAVWLEKWNCGKALDDLCARLWPREPLQQFLQDQPGGHHEVGAQQRVLELLHLGLGCADVPSKCEGPDARVDEEGHVRERSAL